MDRPPSLVGTTVGGAYICERWELRITARCLGDDLNAKPTSDLDKVTGLEIVRAFVKQRSTSSSSSSQVHPLTCGKEVWVLRSGNDHRGGTLYDEAEAVIWLLAYGRHRSGKPDDFFPYCKKLDVDGQLLPTTADYTRMFEERDLRFVQAVAVEVPVVLCAARAADGEYRCTIGGELAVGMSIEIDVDLDATAITVAFTPSDLETMEQGQVLLAALSPGKWEMVGAMPSRELEPTEVAFTVMSVGGEIV